MYYVQSDFPCSGECFLDIDIKLKKYILAVAASSLRIDKPQTSPWSHEHHNLNTTKVNHFFLLWKLEIYATITCNSLCYFELGLLGKWVVTPPPISSLQFIPAGQHHMTSWHFFESNWCYPYGWLKAPRCASDVFNCFLVVGCDLMDPWCHNSWFEFEWFEFHRQLLA